MSEVEVTLKSEHPLFVGVTIGCDDKPFVQIGFFRHDDDLDLVNLTPSEAKVIGEALQAFAGDAGRAAYRAERAR